MAANGMKRKKRLSVSVVIPVYNAGVYIKAALESVIAQSWPVDEVIVVDDGSTDDTVAQAGKYSGRITLLQQKNMGPAAARNRGVREATGALVAFLDADDIWLPDKIARQLLVLQQGPKTAMVYGRYRNMLEKDGALSPPLPPMVRSGKVFTELLVESFILLSTVIVRKEVLDGVGGFDETLLTAEDTNLYLKIAREHRIAAIDEVVVHRRIHGTNLSERVDVPIGTLDNLDRIVALYPDTAPDRFEPMRKAYEKRGGQLVDELFYAGLYRAARQVAGRLFGKGCFSLKIVVFFVLLLLPVTMIDWWRKRRGKTVRF